MLVHLRALNRSRNMIIEVASLFFHAMFKCKAVCERLFRMMPQVIHRMFRDMDSVTCDVLSCLFSSHFPISSLPFLMLPTIASRLTMTKRLKLKRT